MVGGYVYWQIRVLVNMCIDKYVYWQIYMCIGYNISTSGRRSTLFGVQWVKL
jgi:hypothetical protein